MAATKCEERPSPNTVLSLDERSLFEGGTVSLAPTHVGQSKSERRETIQKRSLRVTEALGWLPGSRDEPKVQRLGTLPENLEFGFGKPGEEVFRKRNPNLNDMTPFIGTLASRRPAFSDLWLSMSIAAEKDSDACVKLAALVYRSSLMIDHTIKGAVVRYEPSSIVDGVIESLESRIGSAFDYGVRGFLTFTDLLGWNEDVKYHTESGAPNFVGHFGRGRVNFLLTCIRVPWEVHLFATEVRTAFDQKRSIDHKPLHGLMQGFSSGRGVSPPTQEKLVEWFKPYLVPRITAKVPSA
jgi:hypothetical protein